MILYADKSVSLEYFVSAFRMYWPNPSSVFQGKADPMVEGLAALRLTIAQWEGPAQEVDRKPGRPLRHEVTASTLETEGTQPIKQSPQPFSSQCTEVLVSSIV